MASYNELNALIDAYINRNGVQAITGQILNGVLKAMVEQLGRGYTIMGAAIPTTDPGTPDGPECYFASETGTYTDFDGLQIVPGELALLCYTPSDGWTKETIYEGFQEVQATIDGNVGTPSVGVSYANGVLSFDFHNMKGNPGADGNDGAPAGFGTIDATVDGNIGTPGVSVQTSGPNTAKNLTFAFTNLKGETGVTSVVATVDNTTGTPACTVSLVGQQLTLAFSGLKGAQGNTGSSVDYPFTIVNNLTTDDATQALSAAQGVVLKGEITQLEAEVTDLEDTVKPSTHDFAISDEDGNDIVQFDDGHIKTKNFDSREQVLTGEETDYDFSVADEGGNTILGLVGGEIKTKNFDSKKVSNSRVKICSDDVAYAVVGDKLQIYYNSILRCVNYKGYDIDAVCDIGRSFPRYFEVTPVLANVGEHQLTITIKDNNSKEIGKKNIRLVVKSPSTPANPLNVFCIGASTTQGGQWVSELQRRLTGNGGTPSGDGLGNIAMVGRMAVTFNGIETHLEATGGYSFADYVSTTTKRCRFTVTNGLSVNVSVGDKYSWDGHTFTVQEKNMSNNYFTCDVDDPTLEIYNVTGGTLSKVSGDGDATIAFTSARSVGNPFVYDGQVDFAQYITDYCGGRVDVVLANLLINGSLPYDEVLDDYSAQFAPMLTFINYMLTAQPNAKIGIIVPPLPSQNGGLGHDYGANNPYGLGNGLKVTFQNMHDAVKEFIEQNNLSGSVFMVDFTSVCDSENNFPTEEVPVNPRSTITELRGINGLHPLLSGYMQMADAAYRMFVNRFC